MGYYDNEPRWTAKSQKPHSELESIFMSLTTAHGIRSSSPSGPYRVQLELHPDGRVTWEHVTIGDRI